MKLAESLFSRSNVLVVLQIALMAREVAVPIDASDGTPVGTHTNTINLLHKLTVTHPQTHPLTNISTIPIFHYTKQYYDTQHLTPCVCHTNANLLRHNSPVILLLGPSHPHTHFQGNPTYLPIHSPTQFLCLPRPQILPHTLNITVFRFFDPPLNPALISHSHPQ